MTDSVVLAGRAGPPDQVGEEILRVSEVERIYPLGHDRVTALKGINVSVRTGQLVGLMGRSGSGKTTLLNIIGGLDRPTAGHVFLNGRDILTLSDIELTKVRRATIGYVFQSFALIPVLSAIENVELPMHIAGLGRSERRRRAIELLQLVGLGKRMNHRPFELSGGEQQRVAIARAMANRPALILADEPTGELDSANGLAIMSLFRNIAASQKGVAVVVATHDPTIMQIAHVTYEISDGVITQVDTPTPLFGS
ncbi:MAG TPA: ABC transporter ATP-binding protein [Chloroflexota bacterium]|nr:ABC transporter ATP-binding protein [Chloroflexota bacterium]